MTDLPHVIVGHRLGEEHTRVYEAYLRERDTPLAGHRRIPTAAEVNQAVDWWNALGPEATGPDPDLDARSDEFLAALANPIRLEPRVTPIRDGGRPR